MPAVEEIVTTRPERWARITGRTARVRLIGSEQGRLDLRPEVLGADLLEEPSVEVARVVDQDVDAAEPVHRRTRRSLDVVEIGDVELDRRAGRRGSPSAAVTRSVLRPVATTAWPAASAAFAMSTPMPRPAPVMSQTFFSLMRVHFLLFECPSTGLGRYRVIRGSTATEPALGEGWETLSKGYSQ